VLYFAPPEGTTHRMNYSEPSWLPRSIITILPRSSKNHVRSHFSITYKKKKWLLISREKKKKKETEQTQRNVSLETEREPKNPPMLWYILPTHDPALLPKSPLRSYSVRFLGVKFFS
jgi:hypothetical protein